MINENITDTGNVIRAESFAEGESVYKVAKEIKELENNMDPVLRIGDKAPNFNASTTFGPMSLNDYKGKWLILFSHPGDFTPD